jgi:hypothetical protein
MIKMSLVKDMARHPGRDFDTRPLGFCVVKAVNTAACPINLDKLRDMIAKVMGQEVVTGTYTYTCTYTCTY